MRELNEKHVYDLSELTNDELQSVWNYLMENDEDWADCTFEEVIKCQKRYRLVFNGRNWSWDNTIKPTANAKELFYTLENIQVDCRYLTRKQIKEMTDVFEKNGYEKWMDSDALKIQDNFTYLRIDWVNEFYINGESDNKTTITYEKFMELFGNKEKSEEFKNLVEVLNEELTEEYNKPEYEVTMIAEQPTHPSIAILDKAVELSNELKAYKETSNLERSEESFKEITNSIADLLIYKNEKYGNSALNPLDIFNGKTKVGQRIDDKLARVKNSKELRKNDIADLLGYLTLVCQENNWTNFDEFKD